ncbi:hypothetical protein, partial [Enterobacter cloacae complex sp. GF14B]|uniref:hypothetical protein n=1 Tax=Enterobacter cloacae complex sp. GF14B TaxID=2511982 RepID=UPI001113237E
MFKDFSGARYCKLKDEVQIEVQIVNPSVYPEIFTSQQNIQLVHMQSGSLYMDYSGQIYNQEPELKDPTDQSIEASLIREPSQRRYKGQDGAFYNLMLSVLKEDAENLANIEAETCQLELDMTEPNEIPPVMVYCPDCGRQGGHFF